MMAWLFGIHKTALAIQGPAHWLQPLQQVWVNWLPQEQTSPWAITVTESAALLAPPAPLFEAWPRCRGAVCELVAPGFHGHIDAAQQHARLQAHPDATPADIGYFIRVTLAVQTFTRGGLLFHAAGVVHREKGYALFGLSGSGKTTAAHFSTPDPVLNDDLLLLWPDQPGWRLHATPFGKRRGEVQSAPLHAFLRLLKSTSVYVEPLGHGRALAELVANTPVLAGDPVCLSDVMERWEKIIAEIPVYALYFRREPTFWEVIDAELG